MNDVCANERTPTQRAWQQTALWLGACAASTLVLGLLLNWSFANSEESAPAEPIAAVETLPPESGPLQISKTLPPLPGDASSVRMVSRTLPVPPPIPSTDVADVE
jgi:hypothetical protein